MKKNTQYHMLGIFGTVICHLVHIILEFSPCHTTCLCNTNFYVFKQRDVRGQCFSLEITCKLKTVNTNQKTRDLSLFI